jgi:hypothetical protein
MPAFIEIAPPIRVEPWSDDKADKNKLMKGEEDGRHDPMAEGVTIIQENQAISNHNHFLSAAWNRNSPREIRKGLKIVIRH